MLTRNLVQSNYNSLAQKKDKWKELYSHDALSSGASKILNVKGKETAVINRNS